IVYGILSAIIYAISWRLGFIVSIIGLVGLVFLVISVLGIINAAGGRAKELPIIGKFKILK
ncbi:MAG: zinc ribbon domain-containing protein, partial [Bacillota bacterium]|nr:zinc ribbon domain-containing protein [Bacillota bacterium]